MQGASKQNGTLSIRHALNERWAIDNRYLKSLPREDVIGATDENNESSDVVYRFRYDPERDIALASEMGVRIAPDAGPSKPASFIQQVKIDSWADRSEYEKNSVVFSLCNNGDDTISIRLPSGTSRVRSMEAWIDGKPAPWSWNEPSDESATKTNSGSKGDAAASITVRLPSETPSIVLRLDYMTSSNGLGYAGNVAYRELVPSWPVVARQWTPPLAVAAAGV